MIASLPMYDTDVTRPANDRLWQAVRQKLGHGPTDLDRSEDPHVTWRRTDLLLSQACGLPYRSALQGIVQLVGTPDYAVDGCPPGFYRSLIVVRAEDTRGTLADFTNARLARNDIRSQSGWAAIVHAFQSAGISVLGAAAILDTGSHAASVQAVTEGRADIAAIDAVTWALLKRDTVMTGPLRVLARTVPTPGLPFVTAKARDAAAISNAVLRAIHQLGADDRRCLMITDFVQIPPQDYLRVPTPDM